MSAASLLTHFSSWNDLTGRPTPVTFSFAADIGTPFSTAQQASARLALAAWDAISGLSFVEVPDAPAGAGIDLRLSLEPMGGFSVLGRATLPPDGDVALNVALFRGDSLAPSATRIGFQTLLHEIGHGLGLSHPAPGTPGAAANTIMIDTLGRGAPVNAPLAWDRQAIQTLYGTPEAETVAWRWDPVLQAVRGEGAGQIEGTAHRDALFGGAGSDLLRGAGGDDILTPGAGDDVIEGGAGLDTLRLDVARAGVLLATGVAESAAGRDRFTGIEVIETLDGAIHLAPAGVVGTLVGLYAAAFGRAPDAGGLAFWADTWRLDPNLTNVARNFIASAEFQAGPGLAARFGAMAETPQPGEDAAALAWLSTRAPAAGPVWVAGADALLVSRMYEVALGRLPDEPGYRFWLGAMREGFSAEGLAEGFQVSPEAGARGGTGFDASAYLLAAARATQWSHHADGIIFA